MITCHRVDLRRGVHVCTHRLRRTPVAVSDHLLLQGLFFDAPEGEFAFLALAIVPGYSVFAEAKGKLRKPRDAVNAPHQRLLLERRWFWALRSPPSGDRSRGLALNREIMPRDEVCLYPLFNRDAQRTRRASAPAGERKALVTAEAAQIGLEFSGEPLRCAKPPLGTPSRHRSATLAGVKNLTGGVIL